MFLGMEIHLYFLNDGIISIFKIISYPTYSKTFHKMEELNRDTINTPLIEFIISNLTNDKGKCFCVMDSWHSYRASPQIHKMLIN